MENIERYQNPTKKSIIGIINILEKSNVLMTIEEIKNEINLHPYTIEDIIDFLVKLDKIEIQKTAKSNLYKWKSKKENDNSN